MRFRRNLERIGFLMGVEVSKTLDYEEAHVHTPLGIARQMRLKRQPVLATVLRAGLPMYQGLLQAFDHAESAFIGAFREHEANDQFHIHLGYHTSPDITGKDLIIADPMLATGSSFVKTIRAITEDQQPKTLHLLAAVASKQGLDYLAESFPDAHIWVAAVDPELNDKSYIVPGLGDAGDLAFGEKLQD
jgi:uracil phosphoribosyltransferase